MTSLTAKDFPEFFRAVNGVGPFPWQSALAEQVLSEGWPKEIRLPTGTGKTSVIDLAVFALAAQAEAPVRTGLRVFFVVDRRLVVDDAARRAARLAEILARALEDGDIGILGEVARALISYGGHAPLDVAVMRGGIYMQRQWARAPNQPLVCLTTVDQIGSRLLFRGYGISWRQRPLQAAMAARDALYIIDEAHLSVPFVETLEAVRNYQALAERQVIRPIQVVVMSATLPSRREGTGSACFRLSDEDYGHPELSRRLSAAKPARLLEVPASDLERRACQEALSLGQAGGVVGVVVNTVSAARAIFEMIKRATANSGERALLLTGRIRPYDRDRLVGKWLPLIRAGRERSQEREPLYVVATQTVEVGADLDFDALVTEAAPFSSLVQRFGRLNRLGFHRSTPGTVLYPKGEGQGSVYPPDDVKRCWEWLKKNSSEAGRARQFDFATGAVERLLVDNPPPEEDTDRAPVLLPGHLDLWAQTGMPPCHPDPDVAPFLHGKDRDESPDVYVVWRADLTESDLDDHEYVSGLLSLVPPRLREALPVPVWSVRAWLSGASAGRVADAEGLLRSEESVARREGRRAVRWAGPDECEVVIPTGIRAGDTVVVPASYGGADDFGWRPESRSPVRDVADLCGAPGYPTVLRLSSSLLDGLVAPSCPADTRAVLKRHLRRLIELLLDEDEETEVTFREGLSTFLSGLVELSSPEYVPVLEVFSALCTSPVVRCVPYPCRRGQEVPDGVVLRLRRRPPNLRARQPHETEVDVLGDGSEEEVPRVSTKVTLRRHALDTARWARRFARFCGLPRDLVRDIRLASLLHDIGKADWRIQALFYGTLAVPPEAPLLAKAGHDSTTQKRLKELVGYPPGIRHEMISSGLLRDNPGLLSAAVHGDLVLYLVGSHHGMGRPFAPPVRDPRPAEIEIRMRHLRISGTSDHGWERLDSGWTDLFWRLLQRYGWWGLAYLEGLLRLADYQASREEARTDG